MRHTILKKSNIKDFRKDTNKTFFLIFGFCALQMVMAFIGMFLGWTDHNEFFGAMYLTFCAIAISTIFFINKYYVLDNPTITDQEYDDAYMELLALEKEYPELKRDDSPTNRVGGEALDSFKKVTHKTPMLSFDDIFNEEEIESFDDRIRKQVPDLRLI